MTQPRIAVLSSRTLFAAGMAATLRRRLDRRAFRTFDAQQPEAMEQLVAFRPSVVLLDAADEVVSRRYPLGSLFGALPALTIVLVDPQDEQVQVVTSQQRAIRRMSDIVDLTAGPS